jgi:hypothetical protein
MKPKDIYYYELPDWTIVIGERGGTEYKVNKWRMMSECDKYVQALNGMTRDKQFQFYLKLAIRISQEVDFEEIIEAPKLLS